MNTFEGAIPAQILPSDLQGTPDTTEFGPLRGGENLSSNDPHDSEDAKLRSYIVSWKTRLRKARIDKRMLWDECWQLYRGVEDWSDKDEWQSKIFLPKSWASVEQATSVIKRLLATNKKPWFHEPYNTDDLVLQYRAGQMTELTKVFLEKADFLEQFAEGLKSGFIMGVGLWKIWWGLQPRERVRVNTQQIYGPDGQPTLQKQTTWEEFLEGQLFIRAVDPYNFFWLPGSKFNRWVGTIEDIEIPRWELMELAKQGLFDVDKVKLIQPQKIDEYQKKSYLRFNERPFQEGIDGETSAVKLTEYYGPIIIDDEVVEKHGHALIANDSVVLRWGKNNLWHRKPPYVGFTPLSVPFRTEGSGLIEMVRAINKGLNKIANLSMDTLLYRLLPVFEVVPEVYENPEDFESGLTPGKIFRRNQSFVGQAGITPVPFEDISSGTVQVAAQLDRASQEGSLITEVQQSIPRYRGVQTATEIETKQANQDSFFGAMASDIETQAIKPIVEMATDLILQFLVTSNDPRVASILGVGADALAAMTREELIEIIQGDYRVKVGGITDQLEKAEMLQNLVQLMNILGQNPQAWMPYIQQDALLRRVLEAFRPAIHDIEDIVADPATAQARQAAIQRDEVLTPQLIGMIPQLTRLMHDQEQSAFDRGMQQQQMGLQQQQMALDQRQQMFAEEQAAQQAQQAQQAPTKESV